MICWRLIPETASTACQIEASEWVKVDSRGSHSARHDEAFAWVGFVWGQSDRENQIFQSQVKSLLIKFLKTSLTDVNQLALEVY